MGRRLVGFALLVLLSAGCGSAETLAPATPPPSSLFRSPPPGASPGASAAPPAAGPCLSTTAATAVWTDVEKRLSAVQLDPAHAGLAGVATGIAASQLQVYIQEQLVAQHLTEREVDRLDSLRVVEERCGPTTLTVEVRETLVSDDYLGAGGRVDHADPNVGTQLHLRESYVAVGGAWKLSDQVNLDAPPPSVPPQAV